MPEGYRIELSPNKRAGCKSGDCKKAGVKIQKEELRFGTMVTIKEHSSLQYRHWGCVTPKVISNVKAYIDGDFDLLDGFEELPADIQEKVKRALEQGHVDDEDWKGDPSYNRVGKNGTGPRKRNAPKPEEGDESGEEATTPVKPLPKKRAKAQPDDDTEAPAAKKQRGRPKKEPVDDSGSEVTAAPKKKRGRPAAVKDEGSDVEAPEPTKQKRGRKPKSEAVLNDDDSAAEAEAPVEKEKKPRKAPAKKKAKKEASPVPETDDTMPDAPDPTSDTAIAEAASDEPEVEPEAPKAKAGRKKGGKNKKKD